jgi:hypothetical protein
MAEAEGEVTEAATRYADAAARWESFAVAPERALALLGAGRCGVAAGSTADATSALRACRDLCHELGMVPALREADDLLARATARSF